MNRIVGGHVIYFVKNKHNLNRATISWSRTVVPSFAGLLCDTGPKQCKWNEAFLLYWIVGLHIPEAYRRFSPSNCVHVDLQTRPGLLRGSSAGVPGLAIAFQFHRPTGQRCDFGR